MKREGEMCDMLLKINVLLSYGIVDVIFTDVFGRWISCRAK